MSLFLDGEDDYEEGVHVLDVDDDNEEELKFSEDSEEEDRLPILAKYMKQIEENCRDLTLIAIPVLILMQYSWSAEKIFQATTSGVRNKVTVEMCRLKPTN
ncbi:hypothetical protein ACH5RR_020989 [Cinchona calisaya]|uniref:Uncharacterized protein n=1 Tax=Cinchona calisaya TaxID=153742 RepID=A0ABD2ZJH9_9GENT